MEMEIYARHRDANTLIGCNPLSSSLDSAACILQFSTSMNDDSKYKMNRVGDNELEIDFSNVYLSGTIGTYRLSLNGVILAFGSAKSDETRISLRTNNPIIYSVAPSSGYGGQIFTLSGRNFGGGIPTGCGEFGILIGTSECIVTGKDSDGNDLGWQSDDTATCRAESASLGMNALKIIRSALQSPASVFLDYLGDDAPMSNEDLADAIWADAEVTVRLECPSTEASVRQDWNIANYTNKEDLLISVSNWRGEFCDVLAKVQIIPKNFMYPTVLGVRNVGDVVYCADNDADPLELTDCNPFGSDGDIAVGIDGLHFAEWDEEALKWNSRVMSIMVEQAFVTFIVVNSTYLELNLPPNTGTKNSIILRDFTGSSDLNGKISYVRFSLSLSLSLSFPFLFCLRSYSPSIKVRILHTTNINHIVFHISDTYVL